MMRLIWKPTLGNRPSVSRDVESCEGAELETAVVDFVWEELESGDFEVERTNPNRFTVYVRGIRWGVVTVRKIIK